MPFLQLQVCDLHKGQIADINKYPMRFDDSCELSAFANRGDPDQAALVRAA